MNEQQPSYLRPILAYLKRWLTEELLRRGIGSRFIDGGSIRGGVEPSAHASTHQNGGADELSVAGLSGVLADPQTPKVHEIVDHTATGGSPGDVPTVQADGSLALQAPAGGGVTVEETDGTPSVDSVSTIRVTNGTLSDLGGGVVSLEINPGTYAERIDPIGTRGYKVKLARLEAYVIGYPETKEIANLTGSGMVLSIWMATRQVTKDGVLSVYVDGEATPSIQFDLGTLGSHWTAADVTGFTPHVAVEADIPTAGHACFTFTFPIPFGNGCRITFTSPAANAANMIFAQILYTNDLTDSRRLKSVGCTYLNKATIPQGGSLSLADISATGNLVWSSFVMAEATTNNFMESDVQVTVDEEASPSIVSTGIEDWFLSGWYFGAGLRSNHWSYTTLIDTTNHRMVAALDLLALCGGIHFDSRLQVSIDASEMSDTSCKLSYLLLYYVGASSGAVAVRGSGTPGNVTQWSGAEDIGDSGVAAADLRDATKLQGRTLASTAPTDGQALVWNDDASQWEPGDVAASGGLWEPLVFGGELLLLGSDVLMLGVS